MASADHLCWISSFSHQRQVFQQKLSGYWISVIDSCKNDARALWRKVHTLMTPPQSDSSSLSENDFAVHFSSKIDKIRASTTSAPSPKINARSADAAPLSSFRAVVATETSQFRHFSTCQQHLIQSNESITPYYPDVFNAPMV